MYRSRSVSYIDNAARQSGNWALTQPKRQAIFSRKEQLRRNGCLKSVSRTFCSTDKFRKLLSPLISAGAFNSADSENFGNRSRIIMPALSEVSETAKSCEEEIIKSPKDDRLYRRLTLPNGLAVLLISDPNMITSNAKSSTQSDQAAGDAEEDGDEDAESDDVAGDDEDADEEEDDGEDDDEDAEEGDEDGSSEEGDGEEKKKKKKKSSSSASSSGPTKRAAAAMAVGIGSFSDPSEAEGLSHFLEHMLFMGSTKFPSENEYDRYLTAHGGCCNAFTEAEQTVYHFDVQPSALKGALDRFAQFFISPLMLEEAMDREVNAVDSEFDQCLQSDSCRLMQVQCHTARDGHPYRIFSWGNRKSLVDLPGQSGVDMRALLMQYYQQHYVAEHMSLVILGAEPLDSLQEWVDEIFSPVQSGGGRPRTEFSSCGSPFNGGMMSSETAAAATTTTLGSAEHHQPSSLFRLPAVKDGHTLHFTFPLPSLFNSYLTKPEEYLAHLIGHEGEGSLLAALKAKAWASELCAGVTDAGHERSSAAWLFQVSITLTQQGLDSLHAVVAMMFQYIQVMRQAGPQEWVFKELAAVKRMEFRFLEEEEADDYVVRLAQKLQLVAAPHVLAQDYLMTSWDPNLLHDTLQHFTPYNCRLDLVTSSFDSLEREGGTGRNLEMEPWFQVAFTREVLPESLLQSWDNPEISPLLRLPLENQYIPHDLSVLPCPDPATETTPPEGVSSPSPPKQLLDSPGLRIWYKQDTTFQTPRANVFLCLTSPTIIQDARSVVLTSLVFRLVSDKLTETTYLADIAGLHSSLWCDGPRMSLKVDGFSDKILVLLRRILKELGDHSVDQARFNPIHEDMMRSYKNHNIKPTRHANYLRLRAIRKVAFTSSEQLSALESLTPQDVVDFLPRLLQTLHAELLIHGNLPNQAVQQVAGLVSELVLSRAERMMAPEDRPRESIVRLEPGAQVMLSSRVKNSQEENSAVEVYFQLGPGSVKVKSLLDMLEQVIYEPCWDTLRTKEQLGYTVSSGARNTGGMAGFLVLVQSSKYSVEHIQSRVFNFLNDFVKQLEEMSEDQWQKHKDSLIAMKTQKDKSLYDESDRYWDKIWTWQYDFDLRDKIVKEIRVMKKSELLEWFKEYLVNEGNSRRCMTIGVHGKQHTLPNSSNEAKHETVLGEEGIDAWKDNQSFAPVDTHAIV